MGLGGLLGTIAPIVAGPLIGGILDQEEGAHNRNQQDQINARNYEMQKEFAQNSLRWKMEDAKAAGIHPLAAMGAQGYSASPSYVASEPNYSMGNMAREMGQNISRAVASTMTPEERIIARERVRGAALENDLLALQVKKAQMELNPNPPFPTYGNWNKLSMNYAGGDDIFGKSDPLQASVEMPPVSDVTFRVTPTGLKVDPSRQFAQAGQNSMLTNLGWDLEHRVAPMISAEPPSVPPDRRRYPLPKGYDYYRWNRWAGEWQPAKSSENKKYKFKDFLKYGTVYK